MTPVPLLLAPACELSSVEFITLQLAATGLSRLIDLFSYMCNIPHKSCDSPTKKINPEYNLLNLYTNFPTIQKHLS